MSNIKPVFFLLAASLVVAASSTAFAGDWEHIKTENGVFVYEKDVGDDVAFRGVTEVDVHIGDIISVFVDPDQRPHWVDRYDEHETFEQSADHEVYWLKFDMPFGVSDRDYVLRSDYEFHDNRRTFIARTRSVEDGRKGEDDCCVRAETSTKYTFQAKPGEQKTTVQVEVQTDFKGRMPRRVVKSAQEDWPVVTLSNLIDRARGVGGDPDRRVADWHE